MIKTLTTIISYSAAPLLLALHWKFEHDAFLYMFSLLSIVFSLLIVVMLGGLLLLIANEEYEAAAKMPPARNWRIAITVVYQIGSFAYLMYASAFIVSTIFFVHIVLSWLTITAFKYYRKQAELHNSSAPPVAVPTGATKFK